MHRMADKIAQGVKPLPRQQSSQPIVARQI
jgi:hypothetical protein